MLKGEIILGLKVTSKERLDRRVEGREDASFSINLATMRGSVQIKRTHHMTMIKITPGATPTIIKGMVGSMEKEIGMQEIKEVVNPPRKQGIPGMNQMLLTIRNMSII